MRRVRIGRVVGGVVMSAVLGSAILAGCSGAGGGGTPTYYGTVVGTSSDGGSFSGEFTWTNGGIINQTASGYTLVGSLYLDPDGLVQVSFDVDTTGSPKVVTSMYGTTPQQQPFTSSSVSTTVATVAVCPGGGVTLDLVLTVGSPAVTITETASICDPALTTQLI